MAHLPRALDALRPGGLEFKLHILRRLLDNDPKPLSASQIREEGPNRTDASTWYALKALERIGAVVIVPRTNECSIARYRLADGAHGAVSKFLAARSLCEPAPPLSPLPGSPQHQQVLTVLCAHPDTWFTVNDLTTKLIRLRKCARRPTMELYDAGYLLRRMSYRARPGRTSYQYRLNPDAARHAHALLDTPARSTNW
ncbi:hypothetical protein SAMN05216553_102298 [Lentzea fradiae]|uniref:Uncharacterized protein n=1 Tax=Lentzea fradiae TaxID=200378 RepID=A0A1G7MGR3_9PSEU|nr:hypothetical protein [Lentzea fradiae]SDF60901.1 hypothetical protein SAMN05216553_102298 [Lentzea fradiae]